MSAQHNLHTATVEVFTGKGDKKVQLVFNTDSFICIQEDPIELLHESKEDDERHQNVSMMTFQEKVSMLLRAKLKATGLQPPLPCSQYRVNIIVTTPRKKDDVPFMPVMKAVLDGINREIIDDDRQIYSCDISYKQKTIYSNASKSTSHDSLKIEIYDIAPSSSTPIVEVSGDFYIVQKQSPILKDGGNRLIIFDSLRYQELAAPLKQSMKIKPCSSYSIEMFFYGNTYNKDIDNMALTYYPILGELGISEAQVQSLHLEKCRDSATPRIEIRINCTTP